MTACMKIIPFFLLIFTTVWGVSGCKSDPCEVRSCQNGGVCIDGFCDCPEGFVGVNCELSTDPCLNKNCHPTQAADCVSNNDGEALCICEDGFEGELCEDLWTDKYVGQYYVAEVINGTSTQEFFARIESGPRFKQLTISNFHNQTSSGTSAKIVVNLLQANVFDIYEQFMTFGVVTGAGSYQLSTGNLSLNYQIIESSGDTLNCVATFELE